VTLGCRTLGPFCYKKRGDILTAIFGRYFLSFYRISTKYYRLCNKSPFGHSKFIFASIHTTLFVWLVFRSREKSTGKKERGKVAYREKNIALKYIDQISL
jgi:hypothetical protein